MPSLRSRPWRRDPSKLASGKPGAVQTASPKRSIRVVIPARISPDLQPREAAPATEAAEMRQHLCGSVVRRETGKE
jgi:hypothetical protein